MPVQAAVKCRLRRPARSVGPADRPAARPARSHARPAGRLPVRPPVLPGRATAHAFGLLTRSGSRVRRPHRLHAPSRDRTAPHAAQCSHDGLPLAACQPRPACNPYGGGNNLSNTCAPQVRQVPLRYPTPCPPIHNAEAAGGVWSRLARTGAAQRWRLNFVPGEGQAQRVRSMALLNLFRQPTKLRHSGGP